MKKKQLQLICFLIIFIFLLQGVILLLKIADSNTLISMRGLQHEAENDIDVLLLGQSEVYTGFIPTDAYQTYGFTSFDYGLSAMPANMFPAMLNEATKKQKPKVLVVEVTAFSKPDSYYERTAEMHSFIDNLPLGRERLSIIRQSVPKEQQSQFIKPISTYHNNYKLPRECGRTALVRLMTRIHPKSTLKGFSCSAYHENQKQKKDEDFTFTAIDENYLNNFIVACQNSSIEHILFVRFPHAKEIADQEAYNKLQQTITSAGYEFLDLNTIAERPSISTKKDFYSADHLNLYGARKNTEILGKYLQKHYALGETENSDQKKRWEQYCKDAEPILTYGDSEMENNSKKRIFEYSLQLERLFQIAPSLLSE